MTMSLSDGSHAYETRTAKVIQVHRSTCSGGWGIFTLHDNGLLQCFTDYGNYQYHWRKAPDEESLEKFLVRINDEYIIDKFSYPLNGGEIFYSDETIQEIKGDIIKFRREYSSDFSKQAARDVWDEVLELEEYETSEGFSHAAYYQKHLCQMYEEFGGGLGTIPHIRGPHYKLKAMMKLLWPSFKEALKIELAKNTESHKPSP